MKSLPPALRVGERVRLTPDGPVLEVMRVSPCAAYVGRKVKGKDFEAWDAEARAYKTVPGIERVVVEAISLYSFVERVTVSEDGEG